MSYSGAGRADICMQKDWIDYQIGCKKRNIIIVASVWTKVPFLTSHNIFICHIFEKLSVIFLLTWNMDDRLANSQGWCIAFLFLLEAL